MGMEIKSIPFESKVDLDKNTFEGYAAAFGNVDSHNDIIEHGAFTKTLQEFAKRIKVLWQHDFYSPIGIPLHMEEDSKGLFVKAKVSQTTQGKDALILMKDGVINELSIGYNTIKHETDEDTGIRRLKEIKLLEFSPVTWASNELAGITSAKSNARLEMLLEEMVEGKALKTNNKVLINQAIESLKALIVDDEPPAGTHSKDKSQEEDVEPNIHSILEEIQQFKKTLGGI